MQRLNLRIFVHLPEVLIHMQRFSLTLLGLKIEAAAEPPDQPKNLVWARDSLKYFSPPVR